MLYPGIEAGEFSCKDYGDYFLYVCRFVPEKDIEFAISAFRIFQRKSRRKFRLVVAGAAPAQDTPYYSRIRELSGDGVELCPNAPEDALKALYSQALCCLYTPVNEDFGLVPLEGMASCKPCIAKDEGGPRETVDEGKDGFLVKSPEQMAEKMLLLANDEGKCERMGKAGRKKVLEKFTWEIFLKRFGKVAKEVADRKMNGEK